MSEHLDMDAIEARANLLPEGLEADWEGSNHYELLRDPAPSGDWWWLGFRDLPNFGQGGIKSDTEVGQRLGLVLDTVAAYRPDTLALVARVRELERQLEKIGCQP